MAMEDEWLLECRVAFSKEEKNLPRPDMQGCFGRFFNFAEQIDLSNLLKHLKKTNPGMLVVGGDFHGVAGYANYDAYELIAYLEGNDLSYSGLDIINVVPKAIERFYREDEFSGKRTHFQVSIWDLMQTRGLNNLFEEYWRKYLKWTKQREKRDQSANRENYVAKIPKSLQRLLSKDRVGLFVGDIATSDLPESKYGLVVCRNVLYQLSSTRQKLALHNISRAMKKNSLLLLGDGFGTDYIKLAPEIGEWFWVNEEWQERLKLKRLEVENAQDRILIKT